MQANKKIAIAGIGIKTLLGEDLKAFARVLYQAEHKAIRSTYTVNETDLVQVILEGLRDAGIGPEAHISVWLCSDLPVRSLDILSANYQMAITSTSVTSSFAVGLDQAIASFHDDSNSVKLVIAKDDLGVGALVLFNEHNLVSGDAYAIVESHCRYELAHTNSICQDALLLAGIDPGEVGYLETTIPNLHDWVLDAYRDAGYDLTCAWGSLAGNFPSEQIDYRNPNISICSLVKTLIAINRRTLPSFPGWRLEGERRRWHHTPFYTVGEPSPWFIEPGKTKRYAAWLDTGREHVSHLILSESSTSRTATPVLSQLGEKTVWLFPVTGQTQLDLLKNLKKLQDQLNQGIATHDLFAALINAYSDHAQAPFAIALVGRDRDEIAREIELAISGVGKAFSSGKTYRTPRGSVFTPDPQRDGEVAFVYPGAFNSYVGFGRDLLQHFPFLHERLSVLISNVGRSLAERRLYPRSLERMTAEEKDAWALRLTRNPIAMIESGTTFAIAYSMIMRELFEVLPQSAMGYSLGEISMLWSAGVWSAGDAGSEAWHASPLFKTRLFGPKEAVREAWDIQPADDTFWSTYLLKAPEDKVRALVAQEPRVYLTIVNLPGEVVIAGDGEGCQRVIKSLGCHAIKTPFDSVIHNEVVRSEYDTFVKLYTHPINHKPDVVFYSAAEYAPLKLTADGLAHAIADMTCKPVHLPRLVQTIYEGGARIFIELGPQATCTRWISRILKDKPHSAVPINRTGMGDYHGVIGVLAQLITNRIHVNLLPLLPMHQENPIRQAKVNQDRRIEELAIHHGLEENNQRSDLLPETDTVNATISLDSHHGPPDLEDDFFPGPGFQQQKGLAQNHQTFLQTRHQALQNVGALIEMQMSVANKILNSAADNTNLVDVNTGLQANLAVKSLWPEPINFIADHPLFTKRQLEEFASGNVEHCFGDAYAVYRGRRLPRIPNSDLLLMDRILEIDGTQGVFDDHPTLISEYDVPMNAWFLPDTSDAKFPPYSVLMEIALQPCGFLSAYLGSTLSTPQENYFFRNLDGFGQLLSDYPVRGKTIRNKVTLISSISLRGIIMQRYEFSLSCESIVFYKGGATFGYFTEDALTDQVGLDKGDRIPPYYTDNHTLMNALPVPPKDQLHGLESCVFYPQGGRFGHGYIYGEAIVDPSAWFFDCHFFQDPVMPGSLGVDLMYQALGLGIKHIMNSEKESGYVSQSLGLSYAAEDEMKWVYRGQVRKTTKRIEVEVHIKHFSRDLDGYRAIAEASLWADGLRIYSVENLKLQLSNNSE